MKSKTFTASEEIIEILFDFLISCGLSPEQACEKSVSAYSIITERFTGNRVYFPRTKTKQRERDEQIYAAHEFGGISLALVAKHAGISKSRAWRIVRTMKKEFETKRK